MTKNSDRANPEVEATKQIYEIARREADIEMTRLRADIDANKEEAFSVGVIRTNKAYRDYGKFLDVLVLYRMQKSKAYKKAGMTWEEFCEAAGYPRRTAETMIAEIAPMFDALRQNLPVLAGITFNDIRWLGKAMAAGSAAFAEDGKSMTIGEDQIPATHEDIAAYINHQREVHKTEKEELEAKLSATKKVMADKERLINKQELALKRMEKKVDLSELTEAEQDAINLLTEVQYAFQQGILDIKKMIQPHEAPEIALRSYYFLLLFVQKLCTDEREKLNLAYADAGDCPWDILEQEIPDPAAMVDNLPCFAGQGVGEIFQAKIAARKAKAEARKKGKAGKEGGTDA
jgi:microcompartment protein CcmL/EutN